MAHRQAALMAVSERSGSERYRFYLQNASMGLEEIEAPDGWKTAKYAIKRNTIYWGVTRIVSFNDLTFRKKARDFIRDVYEPQGVNALIIFTVTRMNETTGVYATYFTGKIDLISYKIDQTGVQCQVLDTSFAEKVKNRENQKVNIYDLISVEGYEINAFSYEDTRRLELPTSNLWLYGRFVRNDPYISLNATHYVPMYLTAGSDFPEAQSQNIAATDPFFLNATASRIITIDGHAEGTVVNTVDTTHLTITINLYVGGVLSQSWSDQSTGTHTLDFRVYINKQFTIAPGESAYLEAVVTAGWPGTLSPTITYFSSNANGNKYLIREIAYSLDPIWVKSWPIYETFWRVVQKITDSTVCFYSTFFGRTDTPLDTYPTDGQLGHIAKGRLIKDAESAYSHIYQEYSGYTMELSLSDIYRGLDAIYHLGMGIENINGTDRVVIENRQYFFDSNVILDLSSRVIEDTIGKEVIPDKFFSRVEAGYNSYEYLSIAGGIFEFNAKTSFSTVISAIDNLYDIKSKLRADTNGINLLRFKATDNEDTKGEEDIFIIDSIRLGVDPDWVARTSEDFSVIEGTAGVDDYFNLLLTPKRNLIRHGATIRASLEKNLGTYIRYQASDKNTELTTQLTTETDPNPLPIEPLYPLVENTDILVNNLEEPFFLPEFYTCECVMYNDDLEALKANPKGLIKIATDKYGWIWDFEQGSKENKGTLKLLRANLNVITPT